MTRTIAIDFDGTLCDNQYPYIGRPHWAIIHKAQQEKANGSAIILWTCREGELLEQALAWCKNRGLTFDAVNDSTQEWKEMFKDNPRKIGATEYWDDKAVDLTKVAKRKVEGK